VSMVCFDVLAKHPDSISSTNLNRQLVLFVFERCHRHSAAVVSADEFINRLRMRSAQFCVASHSLSRLVSVEASNDPIARALTFDVLACFGDLIEARADVRHRLLCKWCKHVKTNHDLVVFIAGLTAGNAIAVRRSALRAVERLVSQHPRIAAEAATPLFLLYVCSVEGFVRLRAAPQTC
jgi:hypothetical protein